MFSAVDLCVLKENIHRKMKQYLIDISAIAGMLDRQLKTLSMWGSGSDARIQGKYNESYLPHIMPGEQNVFYLET